MPIRLDKDEAIFKVRVDVVTVLHIVSGVVLPLLADAKRIHLLTTYRHRQRND